MALDDDTLLQHQGCLVGAAEVWLPWGDLYVVEVVDVQPRLRHLRPIIPLALRRPRPVFVRLHLAVEADLVDLFFLRGRCLGQGVVVRGSVLLVSEPSEIRFLRHRALHVDGDDLLAAMRIGHSQLERVGHNVVLGGLLLVVVNPQLDARAVANLKTKVSQGPLVGQQLPHLDGSRQVHQEQRILRDAEFLLQLAPDLADGLPDVDLLCLAIALRKDHEVDGARASSAAGADAGAQQLGLHAGVPGGTVAAAAAVHGAVVRGPGAGDIGALGLCRCLLSRSIAFARCGRVLGVAGVILAGRRPVARRRRVALRRGLLCRRGVARRFLGRRLLLVLLLH
mmetsp:Transcript_25789/g.74247  ORF Transcript_25789/g.74247 Transcript_25789/m.74247 type:complete len:338 (+) Transcript_25789:879-1892(+)